MNNNQLFMATQGNETENQSTATGEIFSIIFRPNVIPLSIERMKLKCQKSECTKDWKIEQPTGKSTRSFNRALPGSVLRLRYIFANDDGVIRTETWKWEYFIKVESLWFKVPFKMYSKYIKIINQQK